MKHWFIDIPKIPNIDIHFILLDLNLDVCVNLKKKKYKEKICSELSNISNKNPKAFWDILNNLNRLKDENSKTDEILPQEDFIKFYEKSKES
jgi:hypothetical protein